MATYESIHTGQAVDQATDKVLANKSKGTSSTPIYLDDNGAAQPISKDATPVEDSAKLVESGGVYTELSNKYNKADISIDDSLGTSTVLIPSEGAVKTYIDNAFAGKQNALVAGDGISISGSTVSVDSTDFMSDEVLSGKRQHFSEELPVGYQSDVLAKMERAKHSSFDEGKFTVEGSTIVTEDGIASGFTSYSTYILGKNISIPANSKIEIILKLVDVISLASTENQRSVFSIRNADNTLLDVRFSPAGASVALVYANGATTRGTEGIGGLDLTGTYFMKFVFDNGTLNAYKGNTLDTLSQLGNTVTDVYMNLALDTLYIGTSLDHATFPFKGGSIDLKYFQIIVNDVPYFSGNKTGIDTIKPDDYTPVPSTSATFTLTEDGILSNTDNSNFLAANKSIVYSSTSSSTLKIKFKCKTSSSDIASTTGDVRAIYWSQADKRLTFNKNGYLVLEIGGTNWLPSQGGTSNPFYNENVDVEIICEGRKQTLKVTLSDGRTLTSSLTSEVDYTLSDTYTLKLGQGILNTWGLIYGANLDLNSFRVYEDDELVYQPCLKIPYTLSKDGKKIVDYNYKSRVEDEYGQAGFTPYYTLDTESRGNYKVVGSPTISSDFVASGFSNSNYLTSAITITNNDTLDIDVTFTYNTEDYFQDVFVFGTSQVRVFCNKQGNSISTNIGDGTIIHEASKATLGNPVAGDIIRVKLNMTSTTAMTEMYVNGVLKTNFSPKTGQTYNIASSSLSIGRRSSSEIFRSSIDLNAFKIYVDGNLTYQAVIPPNYTMQTVKPSDLIDSKISGSNIYRQYANQTIEQYGTCTGTTAVPFEKPFMDTNYSLSVPYSAKTKTGFTPNLGSGVTRSWKAKGKVSI